MACDSPSAGRGAVNVPLLGIGTVRHRRLRPTEHAFAYPTYFLHAADAFAAGRARQPRCAATASAS